MGGSNLAQAATNQFWVDPMKPLNCVTTKDSQEQFPAIPLLWHL